MKGEINRAQIKDQQMYRIYEKNVHSLSLKLFSFFLLLVKTTLNLFVYRSQIHGLLTPYSTKGTFGSLTAQRQNHDSYIPGRKTS